MWNSGIFWIRGTWNAEGVRMKGEEKARKRGEKRAEGVGRKRGKVEEEVEKTRKERRRS
jgi:hypothetical protein